MSILQALEFLKSGVTKSFEPSEDRVLVVTQNAIVSRHFRQRDGVIQNVLAVKIGEKIIGNSSSLIGSNGYLDRTVSPDQLELSQLIPMIPFSVMKQAGLNLATFCEVESGGDETIFQFETHTSINEPHLEKLRNEEESGAVKQVKFEKLSEEDRPWDCHWKGDVFNASCLRARHFTGPRLFSVIGVERNEDSEYQGMKKDTRRLFLLDVDRVEIVNGLINPFLVELENTEVKTIAEAYESLKPSQVLEAEKQNLKVLRQGEWFFIPVSELEAKRAEKMHKDLISNENTRTSFNRNDGSGTLRVGRNRPNRVQAMIEIEKRFFVQGTVSHTGREHANLELVEWHEAVPNTSATSWAISGDID